MITSLASSITRTASKQTYYTIRYLVDRDRVDDAYRAYGYFRWVDDTLDADAASQSERRTFLMRQKALLDDCYRGRAPQSASLQEEMLVELVQHDHALPGGLQSYLSNMMRVMEFDAERRGRLISQGELTDYTRWLATAVTECIHYFVGHDAYTPHDATRYLAVSAAHITHMLRDTFDDAQVGYFNIPREVLEANQIEPLDTQSDAYRAWVRGRVILARAYFQAGKAYFARVQSARCRLACFAYVARFEWLLKTIEKEGYVLRPQYAERKSPRTGLQMIGLTLASLLNSRGAGALPQRVLPRSTRKA